MRELALPQYVSKRFIGQYFIVHNSIYILSHLHAQHNSRMHNMYVHGMHGSMGIHPYMYLVR